MTAYEVLEADSKENPEDWLRQRRGGIGASEAAAILGVDPWSTALEVYAEKVNPEPPEQIESGRMRWGNKLEPLILQDYYEQRFEANGVERVVVRNTRILRSTEHEFMIATPDGFETIGGRDGRPVETVAGVQAKSIGDTKQYAWQDGEFVLVADWEEEIPMHVQVQVQHELIVTGLERIAIPVLPLKTRELFWRDVHPHPDFQAVLIERLAAFWRRVKQRDPPPETDLEATRRALAKMYPQDTGAVVHVPGHEVETLFDRYEIANTHIKAAENEKKQISNVLKATIGEATFGTIDDGRYFSAKRIEPTDEACPHCGGTVKERHPYRRLHVGKHTKKKKVLPAPVATRALVDPLTKALEESVEKNGGTS